MSARTAASAAGGSDENVTGLDLRPVGGLATASWSSVRGADGAACSAVSWPAHASDAERWRPIAAQADRRARSGDTRCSCVVACPIRAFAEIVATASSFSTRSRIAAATRDLLWSGNARRRPDRRWSLRWCRRRIRRPALDTSLATIRSACFASRLADALATTFSVSAANPTSSGPVPAARRRGPRSPRMSGVLFRTSVSVSPSLRHLLRARVRRRVVGDGGRHDDDVHPIGARHHGRVHLRGAPHANDLVHRRRIDRRSGRRPASPRRRAARLRRRSQNPSGRSIDCRCSEPDRDPRRSARR